MLRITTLLITLASLCLFLVGCEKQDAKTLEKDATVSQESKETQENKLQSSKPKAKKKKLSEIEITPDMSLEEMAKVLENVDEDEIRRKAQKLDLDKVKKDLEKEFAKEVESGDMVNDLRDAMAEDHKNGRHIPAAFVSPIEDNVAQLEFLDLEVPQYDNATDLEVKFHQTVNKHLDEVKQLLANWKNEDERNQKIASVAHLIEAFTEQPVQNTTVEKGIFIKSGGVYFLAFDEMMVLLVRKNSKAAEDKAFQYKLVKAMKK